MIKKEESVHIFGKIYIESDDSKNYITRIVATFLGEKKVLLEEHPDNDPEKNLTNFHNLHLSSDHKILYFNTDAWATENAVHALNIEDHHVAYLGSGENVCVVSSGQYAGDVVVDRFTPPDNDILYLVTADGKDLGKAPKSTLGHACSF